MTKRDQTSRRRTRVHAAVLLLLLGVGAIGCELALDFDRTKIDGGALDASFGDTALPDQVTPPADGTSDTGTDTGADAGTDSNTGTDTGTDTGSDTGSDTGTDSGADAADADDAG